MATDDKKTGGSMSQRTPINWGLKAAVSALILGLILWLLPIREVWSSIRDVPFWLWLIVVVLFMAGHVIAAGKWWRLAVRPTGVHFVVALRAHFAGLVANLCLPGVSGGDLVRAGLVFRQSENKPLIAAGSLADRIVDCFALLLLAGGGALLSVGESNWSSSLLWQLASFLTAGVVALALVVILLMRLSTSNIVKKLAVAFTELVRRPGELIICLGLSLCVQSAFVGLTIVLAAAAGSDAPASTWFFAWPLAKLIATVPISLAGLGVREASLAALMTPFGANPAKIVAVGLLWQSVLFAGGAIGGLVLVFSSRRRASQTDVNKVTDSSSIVQHLATNERNHGN